MSDAPVRIGHYELLRKLGAGGMGEVHLARDTRLEREVAIKLLPPAFASDAERLERFRREALALASLSHPNIATLHAIEPTPGGGLALVMEYIAGETLESRLERGALPVTEAIERCTQVAEALEVAHERGVVHRDVKPANITLTPRGLVKVLDFGLASRGRDATVEAEGTPGYMSPEQALGSPQDHRTDLFSFGCVLYECLAGKPAFDGPDPFSRVAAAMYGAPDFDAMPADLPALVRTLLEQCLAKDPDARPANMDVVRRVLLEASGQRRLGDSTARLVIATPHNLPRNLTRFVGRERELQNTLDALQRSRLVTLTGVGGCGKTRLALALAKSQLAAYPGGVWFADLAPITDSGRIPGVLAMALGVREEADRRLEDTLGDFLCHRHALLVLDNCEHLLSECAALTETLLEAAPELRVLATSREGLGVSGEQLLAVPSMSAPSAREVIDASTLERFDAVRLFVDRAQAVSPDFTLDAGNATAIAEVCRRLDGIPLALELAAARVKVLNVQQIAARLDDRFKLLTGGSRTAMPRHQTLRATLQWSHDLLLPPERDLLRRLAPFAGGWTLATAARVTEADADEFDVLDVLQHLVDKSLVVVQRVGGGEARYRFLESVRQFAMERLDESGEGPVVRERHLSWMLDLVERGERVTDGPSQMVHFAELDAELENLLAGLAYCAQAEDGAERGLRLATAPWRFYSARGHYELARRVLETALARAGAQGGTPARANALVRAGGFALYQGDYEGARPHIEDSLALYRHLGDEKGVARALSGLSVVATYQGDYAAARACNLESLARYRALGERRGEANALHNLGMLAFSEGNASEAIAHYELALPILGAIGDRQHMALALAGIGSAEVMLGAYALAQAKFSLALTLANEIGAEREVMHSIEGTAELAARCGSSADATWMLAASAAMRQRLGSPPVPAESAARLALEAELSALLGQPAFAELTRQGAGATSEQAMRRALATLEALPIPGTPEPLPQPDTSG